MPPGDRRRIPRRVPDPSDPVTRIRLRIGGELRVVDLSPAGALVEGETRLLPGTHLDVHVITVEGRVLVRTRVARAFVSRLSNDRVTYRGALAFDRQIDLGSFKTSAPSRLEGPAPSNVAGYVIPCDLPEVARATGSSYPA